MKWQAQHLWLWEREKAYGFSESFAKILFWEGRHLSGRVKITQGKCILKVTRPDGECCQNLVSNTAFYWQQFQDFDNWLFNKGWLIMCIKGTHWPILIQYCWPSIGQYVNWYSAESNDCYICRQCVSPYLDWYFNRYLVATSADSVSVDMLTDMSINKWLTFGWYSINTN